MNGYTQCGGCPKCGAPIYLPTIWHGILPPPVTYSCLCFASSQPQITYSNETNQSISKERDATYEK